MDNLIKLFLFIIIHDLINAVGQMLIKQSTESMENMDLKSVRGVIRFLRFSVTNPKLLLALSINSVALIIWLLILSFADLSQAFPLDSLQYIIITIFAIVFLKEKVSRMRWIGILIIILGIIVVGMD